jgi:hypothetical protein
MKNHTHITMDYSPEIREFKRLGRRHLPEVPSEDFWQILLTIEDAGGGWAEISEMFLGGKPVPMAFRNQDWASLKLWRAFTWEDVVVGVLRHPPTGLCRPLIVAKAYDNCPYVGPALKVFSAKMASLACLALLREACSQFGAPLTDSLSNYAFRYVKREDIKDAFKPHWQLDAKSLDDFFEDSYVEETRQ